jgi:hypothetical protein
LAGAIAEVHGATGAVVRWTVGGMDGGPRLASTPDWRVRLGPPKGVTADAVWSADADVAAPEATAVEFTLAGATRS